MKYSGFSPKWKHKIVALEINYYQQCVDELAKENNVGSWTITEDSQEIQDALLDTDYEIVKDQYSGKEEIKRIFA